MVEPTSSRFKLRAENLSDLVFGLALSIGSVILISNFPQNPSDLLNGIVLFGFSFLIVIWIWRGYTNTMAEIPVEVPGAFLLNVVLLFCVAIEPYLFYVVTRSQDLLQNAASSAYGVDVASMMFILAGLKYVVLSEQRKSAAQARPFQGGAYRRFIVAELIGGVIFAASALPFFWTPTFSGDYLRFDVWYVAVAIVSVGLRMLPNRSGDRTALEQPKVVKSGA